MHAYLTSLLQHVCGPLQSELLLQTLFLMFHVQHIVTLHYVYIIRYSYDMINVHSSAPGQLTSVTVTGVSNCVE